MIRYILSVILLLSIIISSNAQTYDNDFELLKNSEIFMNVITKLNTDYVYPVNTKKLITDAINAMLKDLDPYTNYYTEDQIEDYRLQSQSQYIGSGIIVQKIDNRFFISDILKNSPATDAGLHIGDQIIKVNNIPVGNKTLKQLHLLLAGDVNTDVNLSVKQINGHDTNLAITRKNVKISPIAYNLVYDSIGYVKLEQFTDDSYKKFHAIFQNFKSQNINGLIIDLRNNPGGLLLRAVDILSTFLPYNTMVVSVHGKNPKYDMKYFTNNQPLDKEIPIVILVNNRSASASEIVSGAAQDLDRAVIIGTETFGKGLVQKFFDVGYSSKIKITIAEYFIPSGRCIQKLNYNHSSLKRDTTKKFYTANGRVVYEGNGIKPDIVVHNSYKSDFIKDLTNKSMIKFYASYLLLKNPNTLCENYEFSTDDFNIFINNIGYRFENKSSKLIDSIIKTTKDKNLEKDLLNIRNQYFNNTKNLIESNKSLLELLIKQEICRQKQNYKTYFTYIRLTDKQLDTAIKVIKNKKTYHSVLSPK